MSDKYPGGFVTDTAPVQNPALGAATNGIWTMDQAAYAAKNRTWAMYDPQFNGTTLLLHGNGTNGAQNNTFVDSSSNAFTITRNGNTTQGSFSPYGSLWSSYQAATTGASRPAIYMASQSAFAFGTGDFCIEFFVNVADSGALQIFVDFRSAGNSGAYPCIYLNNTTGYLAYYINGAAAITGTTTFTYDTWHHVAVARSGTSTKMFLDGVQQGSTLSDSNNYVVGTASDRPCTTNGDSTNLVPNGYISNLRIVKGQAVYTSAFTPSTTPLTTTSQGVTAANVSLLTLQSNRYVDNSSNGFAVRINGTPSVQRFSPFKPNQSYTPEIVGGSGYFDGTGDYLTTASSSNLALGTGDFTIEGWLYWFGTACRIMGGTTNANTGVSLDVNSSGQIGWGSWLTGAYSTQTIKANAWNHFAYVRASGTDKLYINGVLSNSTTWGLNFTDTTFYIGIVYNTNTPWYGYQSDIRIVKGTAIYSGSTYTMPTVPLTAVANTQLLLSYTNAAIADNAMMNDLETVGNAQVSTSVKKYGTGSLSFDGTNSYTKSNSATSQLYAFGTGNFTIEGWIYLNTTASQQAIIDFRSSPSDVAGILWYNASSINWYVSGSNVITGSALSTSTWYHFALCRSSGSTKLFVNGTQVGSTYSDSNNYICPSGRPYLGALSDGTGTLYLNGYIDDLRITKGVARYTAAFTPPTSQLQDF